MAASRHTDTTARLLGWAGLLLAIGGAIAIIMLGGNTVLAVGMLFPLLTTAVLAMLPALNDRPLIWLITGIWTGAIGVISIFSVGIIFLIATVFLLAAFVRTNW